MKWKPAGTKKGKAMGRIMTAGFILGMLFVDVGKEAFLEHRGILNEYTLYDMKYAVINKNAFLGYVLQKRLGVVMILAVLSTTWLGMAVTWTCAAWLGISFGMLVMTAILRYGLKGVLLVGTGIFPQALLYFPASLFLLQWCREFCTTIYYPERVQMGGEGAGRKRLLQKKMVQFAGVLGVVIMGCFLESYVNPTLVSNLLKIF